MNNLKRVLSLALSGIMLVGMMAMGASAVDFSDADKINNTDAVNTLVSLGVINGKDDGSYGPEEIVTRAQMAKMICVTLNGGKDFKYGTKATPTYSDIKGHWAESYIEYCTSLNIIAGQGDGTFNPDGPVTASAASKMMLVAIGYDADDEGMVGIDWEVNTNRLADNKGFYKDLNSLNVSEGLSRDNAAQVIFNACGAKMVEYDYKLVTNDGNLTTKPVAKDLGYDIFEKKFEVNTQEDVVLTKVQLVTSGVNKGTYNLNDSAYTKVAEDCSSLLGQTVKVLYKDTDEVFGVYADAKNSVVTTNQSAITKDTAVKVKFGGTKYELEADCSSIVDGVANAAVVDADALVNATSYNKVALIDNDGNNKYDVAVITTVTPAKVTYVSSDEIIAGGETYKYEDETIAEGLKKDDYVTVTYSIGTDKNVIEKVEKVEETITGSKDGEFQIDGTWYKDGCELDAAAGDDVTVYIVNGVIYAGEKTSATSLTDVVLVAKVATGGLNPEVKFMYTDGTVVSGTVDTSKGAPATPVEGKFYTVKKATNGYRFEAAEKDIGSNKWLSGTFADGKIGSTDIADDAVVLAMSKDHENKVGTYTALYTGKQLKAIKAAASSNKDNNEYKIEAAGSYTKKVSGLTRVGIVGVIINLAEGQDMPKGSVAGSNYALVLTDSYTVKDATTYDVWTGSDTITVTDEDKNDVSEGDVIVYDAINGTTITGVAATEGLTKAYVQAKSGSDYLYLNGNSEDDNKYEITKDTVVMYYDSAAMEGKAGGEIQLADEIEEGVFIQNVKFIATDSKELSFILVDVKNKLDDAEKYAVTAPTVADVTVTLAGVDDENKAAPGTAITVKLTATPQDGKTVTLVVAEDAAAKLGETKLEMKKNADGTVSFSFVMPNKAVDNLTVTGVTVNAEAKA